MCEWLNPIFQWYIPVWLELFCNFFFYLCPHSSTNGWWNYNPFSGTIHLSLCLVIGCVSDKGTVIGLLPMLTDHLIAPINVLHTITRQISLAFHMPFVNLQSRLCTEWLSTDTLPLFKGACCFFRCSQVNFHWITLCWAIILLPFQRPLEACLFLTSWSHFDSSLRHGLMRGAYPHYTWKVSSFQMSCSLFHTVNQSLLVIIVILENQGCSLKKDNSLFTGCPADLVFRGGPSPFVFWAITLLTLGEGGPHPHQRMSLLAVFSTSLLTIQAVSSHIHPSSTKFTLRHSLQSHTWHTHSGH